MRPYEKEYSTPEIGAETLIYERFRDRESLGGEWHYAVDQYNACLEKKWFKENYHDADGRTLPVDFSFDTWPVMELPCCWNKFDRGYYLYEGNMTFTRKYSYLPQTEGERVFLRIGAANYTTRLFVNGEFAGVHYGGSTPFDFEITELLRPENRFLIQVGNRREPDLVPGMETDWFNYGGIYREIELIRVPGVYIRNFRVKLIPDGCFDKIGIEVELSAKINTNAEIRIHELGIWETVNVVRGLGSVILEAEPELWSPENPRLYDISVSCNEDTVSDKVGFREIKVSGRNILLNGKALFLKGISCHEDSPFTGKALTEEEFIGNIMLAKELGCNFMRAAHYPHSEKLAELADRMGLLLWEEVPVYWGIDFSNENTYRDAANQLKELITRDYNRASVIIWSVGNENVDTDDRLDFMGRLADLARETDGTRPVSAACLVNWEKLAIADRLETKLDIIGLNEYFGWYDPNLGQLNELFQNSNPDKPVIISEFGADAAAGLHGDADQKGTEECQEAIYIAQTACIREIPYVKGMTPWILHDFACPRRTSDIQNYYNTKGLVSADRKYRKKAFTVLKEFYESL